MSIRKAQMSRGSAVSWESFAEYLRCVYQQRDIGRLGSPIRATNGIYEFANQTFTGSM